MKIRSGFVSNSSSSSYIVIGHDVQLPQPRLYCIGAHGETEFGWQNDDYADMDSRINFAYLQTSGYPAWKEMLMDVLSSVFEQEPVVNISGGYIDHQSSSCEGVNTEMFEDEETLKRFLFATDSYIQCGNDNE